MAAKGAGRDVAGTPGPDKAASRFSRVKAMSRRAGAPVLRVLQRADAMLLPDAKRAHRTVVVFFALVYVLTLHPGPGGHINLGDTAKFQFLGRIGGLGHPPGNPLYLMLCALVVRIPVPLEDYVKVNLLSAFCGVFALSFVFRTFVQITSNAARPDLWTIGAVRSAVLGTVLLGLGPTFWLLSTEAEVYTLSSLCSSAFIYGTVRWILERDRRAFAIGLFAWLVGCGNHLAIVALAPAFLFVVVQTRKDLRRPWLFLGALLCGAAIGASAYLYIWMRAKQPLAYSEFVGPLDKQHFIDFVTAKQYQAALGKMRFVDAVRYRLPTVLSELQKQWLWPLLLLAPLGISRFFRGSKNLVGFFGVMTVTELLIPVVYTIPDPEGYFMPVLPFVALMIAGGICALYDSEWRPWLLTGAAATFVLLGSIRFSWFWLASYGADINMAAHEGPIDFVFPTLFESMPEGSDFVVPCGHYGGVELTIYYKMADSTVRRKHIGLVRWHWSEWDSHLLEVPIVDGNYANSHVVCTVLSDDVKKLKDSGVALRRIERTPYWRNFQEVRGAPIYCTGMPADPSVTPAPATPAP
jgi:hypothetical protein